MAFLAPLIDGLAINPINFILGILGLHVAGVLMALQVADRLFRKSLLVSGTVIGGAWAFFLGIWLIWPLLAAPGLWPVPLAFSCIGAFFGAIIGSVREFFGLQE